MRLRRQIIAAAMMAGLVFTLMIYWMVAVTYGVPHPGVSDAAMAISIVLLFWWLVGSSVARFLSDEVTRSTRALRQQVETGLRLRRALEEQRHAIDGFADEQSESIRALSDEAARLADQYDRLLASSAAPEWLHTWLQLADECSTQLQALQHDTLRAQAQGTLLVHDLQSLQALQEPTDAQLQALQRLARQAHLLAVNARIEANRQIDPCHTVRGLSEDIRALAEAASALALAIEPPLRQLAEQMGLAEQHASHSQQHWQQLERGIGEACAVHDEAREAIEQWRQHHAEGLETPRNRLIRTQLEEATMQFRQLGIQLRTALERLRERPQLPA